MAIDKLAGVVGTSPAPSATPDGEKFNKVFQQAGGAERGAHGAESGSRLENAPRQVIGASESGVQAARPGCAQAPGGVVEARARLRVDAADTARSVQAGRVLDQVTQAQQRLEHVLHLAQTGKTFTPAELIAMQANVYRASQELDLAGKVVEKATGGVKQILQTQI